MSETAIRRERDQIGEFLRLLEELRAMKGRIQTIEMARLDEQRQAALETSMRLAERRVKSNNPEELLKATSEARRYVDAEHENSKEILGSKHQKLEQMLQALVQYLQAMGALRERETRTAVSEDLAKKQAAEMATRLRVLEGREEVFARREKELASAEAEMAERTRQATEAMANLDVVARAKELDQAKEDIDGKLKAYAGEESGLEKRREEINRDFDKLGEKRTELDREAESLEAGRRKLENDKRRIAETVAHEMAVKFEALVRDMLRQASPPAAP